MHEVWVHYAQGDRTVDTNAILSDFVGTLWNVDPTATVRVSTAGHPWCTVA